MFVYWLMLAFPAIGALFEVGQAHRTRRVAGLLLGLLFVFYGVLIGFRFEIGADWFGYEAIIRTVQYERLLTALSFYDPAFNLTAWISTHLGFGMVGVNLVCGLLLLVGTFALARTFPNPWLALAAAVPYLLIVVGMGYIRQAAAIGLLMLGLVQLDRGRFVRFLISLVGATTFHVASLVMLPIVGLALARRYPALLIAVGALGAVIFAYVLSARLDSVQSIYVKAGLDSSGTLVRLMMTAIPATLYLGLRRRFVQTELMRDIWTLLSLAALALLGLFLISPSSTAIDRIGLFFSPVQLMTFGYLTSVFGATRKERQLAMLVAMTYFAAVLFIWLQFSFYAKFWVPYHWVF